MPRPACGDAAGRKCVFGKVENDSFFSDDSAFHCWVECDGHVVDFMASYFQEAWRRGGHDNQVSRRMLQKPKTAMARTPYELEQPGDFFLLANAEMTQVLNTSFRGRQLVKDLALACLHNYTKPPAPMVAIVVREPVNGVVTLPLAPLALDGAW